MSINKTASSTDDSTKGMKSSSEGATYAGGKPHLRRVLSPYYKEKYAKQVARLIAPLLYLPTEQLQTKQIVIDCYKYRKRPETIRQLLHWGWQYQIEHFDHEGYYLELRKKCIIKRMGGQFFIRGRRPDEEIEGELRDFIEKFEKALNGWQADLINFVEEAPEGEQFVYNHRMNGQQLTWLSDYLMGMLELIAVMRVGSNGFHLIKNRLLARQQNINLMQ